MDRAKSDHFDFVGMYAEPDRSSQQPPYGQGVADVPGAYAESPTYLQPSPQFQPEQYMRGSSLPTAEQDGTRTRGVSPSDVEAGRSAHKLEHVTSGETLNGQPKKESFMDMKKVVARMKSNWLLIFVIPALVSTRSAMNSIVVFVLNLLAIIPLSRLLTIGLDDIIVRLGPAYAAVLHALAGSVVELIISGFALFDEQYAIVRSALLGAILSNILLVLGIVFLAGSAPMKMKGIKKNLHADLSAGLFVNTSAAILALAFLALVAPATFRIAAPPEINLECDLRNISRGTSIILLFLYAGLLIFQLKTHAKEIVDMTEFDHKEPRYYLIFAVFLIALAGGAITYCAKFLVHAIEVTAHDYRLGSSFTGMVLLPICVMSNAIEHYEAIKHSARQKVDEATSLVLNSSVQIALLVTPILVLIGWVAQKPLTLDFSILEIAVLGCSILIVNFLVADNKANWMEGFMLIASFIIIAIAFFYMPDVPDQNKEVFCDAFSRNLPKAAEGGGGGGGGGGGH